MKRFKNILVLYGQQIGDEAALERAAALAKANHARLTVVEVIEKLPADVASVFASVHKQRQLENDLIAERRAHLERLTASITVSGVDVEVEVLRGVAFLEVVRAVLRRQHDMVIMAADSWQGLRWIPFGSTSMHLMRKCPCPVWVTQPQAGKRFGRIMVAVDPPLSSSAPGPLDVKLLEIASSLARRENCGLDIVNAWDFTGNDLLTSQSLTSAAIRADLVEKNRALHTLAVERLLDAVDLSDVAAEVHLPKGQPSLVIPTLVKQHDVDLIVMGTTTRTGIAGLFIGATAEDVLQQVDCSVLTVKPQGFVSPVALEEERQAS